MSCNTLDSYFGVAGKRLVMNFLRIHVVPKKTVIARDKWNSKWDKAFPWAEKHHCLFVHEWLMNKNNNNEGFFNLMKVKISRS